MNSTVIMQKLMPTLDVQYDATWISCCDNFRGVGWHTTETLNGRSYRWSSELLATVQSSIGPGDWDLIIVLSDAFIGHDIAGVTVHVSSVPVQMSHITWTHPHLLVGRLRLEPSRSSRDIVIGSRELFQPSGVAGSYDRRTLGIAIEGIALRPADPGESLALEAYFDGIRYLSENPDVAGAVSRGDFADGLGHFMAHGRAEGRMMPLVFSAPSSPGRAIDLWRRQIEIANRDGELAAAFDLLQDAVRRYPNDAELRRDLVEILLKRGQFADARRELDAGAAALSHDTRFQVYRGQLLAAMNANADAIAAFEVVLAVEPDNIVALRAHGLACLNDNRFAAALKNFDSLQNLGVEDYELALARAVCARANGEPARAAAAAQHAVSLAGANTAERYAAQLIRITESVLAGDREAALDTLKGIAAKLNSGFAPLLNAAIAQFNIGDLREAERTFAHLQKLSPHSHLARLWLAIVLRKLGRPAEALDLLEVENRSTIYADWICFKGMLLIDCNRLRDAIAELSGGLGRGFDANIHQLMGQIYLRLNELPAARSHLERAYALRPGNPDVIRDLACVRLLTDDVEGATAIRRELNAASVNASRYGGPMELAEPRITVVVPLFNEARFLADCLTSVWLQSFPFWECIIVDDVSSDESARIAESFVQADSRFQLIRHETNKGLSGSRNTGLFAARAPLVTFVDADDFLMQHSLLKRYDVLIQQGKPLTAGTFAGVVHVAEHTYGSFPSEQRKQIATVKNFANCGCEAPFNAHAPLLHTDLLKSFGGFDESMRYGAEDWDMWARLMRHGYHFIPTQLEGAAYRQKRGSMVRSMAPLHVDAAKALYRKLSSALPADAVQSGAPFVFDRPAWYYEIASRFAQRAIRFSAMAYMAGDIEGFWRIANDLPGDPRFYAALQISIPTLVSEGVDRFMADVGTVLRDDLRQNWVNGRKTEIAELLEHHIVSAGSPLPEFGLGQAAAAPSPQRPPAVALWRVRPAAPYDVRDEQLPHLTTFEKLERYRDMHRGERCFIVGNGPSLNKLDLSLLKNEVSIAVNGIFYKTDDSGYTPTYYVVEDTSVMKENIERIAAVQARAKFFPTIYSHMHDHADNVNFFLMNRGFYDPHSPYYCVPRFSTDFARVAYCGQSVTYINLQLAYYMGFKEVYMIGMDFDYIIPSEHKKKGDIILSTTDDPNHFHKDYFGAGKTWKDPKLDRVLMNYKMAKLIYECGGRKIVNATVGGKLDLFDRVDFNSLF